MQIPDCSELPFVQSGTVLLPMFWHTGLKPDGQVKLNPIVQQVGLPLEQYGRHAPEEELIPPLEEEEEEEEMMQRGSKLH